MKNRVFNGLSFLIVAATVLLWLLVVIIFIEPQSFLNPFAPPTLPPLMSLPSYTPTPRSLPATWTPGSGPEIVETISLKTTSTIPATDTLVPFNTFTNTPTRTNTPTNTPTPTDTPTITATATATHDLTATELSRIATSIAETEAAE